MNGWVRSINLLCYITSALIASTFTKLETQPFSFLMAETAEWPYSVPALCFPWVTDRTGYSFLLDESNLEQQLIE